MQIRLICKLTYENYNMQEMAFLLIPSGGDKKPLPYKFCPTSRKSSQYPKL